MQDSLLRVEKFLQRKILYYKSIQNFIKYNHEIKEIGGRNLDT